LKDIIIKAIEEEFLLEIEDETLGFLIKTPQSIITHLQKSWRGI
jgi:hypothetical protein